MSRKTGKEVRMDFYGFYTGTEFEAYDYLGAHMEGGEGIFRTFAPGAKHIAVIGDFNQWTDSPMSKIYDGNFWECRIPGGANPRRQKQQGAVTGRGPGQQMWQSSGTTTGDWQSCLYRI